MPVTRSIFSFGRLAILALVAICASCSVPEQEPDNRYQRSIEDESSSTEAVAAPVIQLQNQALAAINEDQYPLAIDYLQRAIKIQPRNAWNWHYLAQAYWHDGNYDRCLAMIDRSSSYGSYDQPLSSANEKLLLKCQG
jgi:tetratricopeptide (TPR) repeat protein